MSTIGWLMRSEVRSIGVPDDCDFFAEETKRSRRSSFGSFGCNPLPRREELEQTYRSCDRISLRRAKLFDKRTFSVHMNFRDYFSSLSKWERKRTEPRQRVSGILRSTEEYGESTARVRGEQSTGRGNLERTSSLVSSERRWRWSWDWKSSGSKISSDYAESRVCGVSGESSDLFSCVFVDVIIHRGFFRLYGWGLRF